MVSDAIAKGDVAALNYFIADKYIKAFGQLADSPNQKILMLPIEATSILGSLAGIGEIAKATFGESAASAAAAARRSLGAERRPPTPPPVSSREVGSPVRIFETRGRVMAEMFSTLGTWNWLIFGFILMALELWRRASSCSGSGSPRCWSGCCRLRSIRPGRRSS